MPTSLRKRKANRANAQKSHGPVSEAGRAAVSQNATKHGLTGRFKVLDWEDQHDFDNFLDQLMRDEKPVGAAEIELVVKMAEHTWRSKRALRMQDACFSLEHTSEEQKARGDQAIGIRADLPNYIRYHTTHDRAYQRASKELRDRRKERQIAERGFVSQKQVEEKHTQAMAIGKARLQYQELRTAKAYAAILPPDFVPPASPFTTSSVARPGFHHLAAPRT